MGRAEVVQWEPVVRLVVRLVVTCGGDWSVAAR
jgi:hypothetical protein